MAQQLCSGAAAASRRSPAIKAVLLLLVAVCAIDGAAASSRSQLTATHLGAASKKKPQKRKPKHVFSSPVNYFIQERASKQLPGPGQHFQFGALQPWDKVQELLDNTPDSKLLLLVRHGQALSNWLQDTLGPDVWFDVETKCSYDDKNGTIYDVFDAELTDFGREQGRYLNSILDGGGWFSKMTANRTVRAIVSPLSRCLETSLIVSNNLPIKVVSVEELVRETLGEDTCDSRRSVTDPSEGGASLQGPCEFQQGLHTKWPQFAFPIVGKTRGQNGEAFGLVSDADTLWTKDRETQKHQVKRATEFLYNLWANAPEKVIVVYTHSGFTRSVLLAVGREPYRPQNTELVPAVVFKAPTDGTEDDDDEEDWEVEQVEERAQQQ